MANRHSRRFRVHAGRISTIAFGGVFALLAPSLLRSDLSYVSPNTLNVSNQEVLAWAMNFPNPFDSRREHTVITYRLTQESPVRIEIFDVFGDLVRPMEFSKGQSGSERGIHQVTWDGTDQLGQAVTLLVNT